MSEAKCEQLVSRCETVEIGQQLALRELRQVERERHSTAEITSSQAAPSRKNEELIRSLQGQVTMLMAEVAQIQAQRSVEVQMLTRDGAAQLSTQQRNHATEVRRLETQVSALTASQTKLRTEIEMCHDERQQLRQEIVSREATEARLRDDLSELNRQKLLQYASLQESIKELHSVARDATARAEQAKAKQADPPAKPATSDVAEAVRSMVTARSEKNIRERAEARSPRC